MFSFRLPGETSVKFRVVLHLVVITPTEMVRRRVGVRKITRVSHYTLNLLHVVLNTHPGLENRETWGTRITWYQMW